MPIFFVVSGMGLDLKSIAAGMVFAFLLIFYLVRGVPTVLLHRRDLPVNERRALSSMASADLPLIVVITGIGTSLGAISTAVAASLVAAGALSVFAYPLAALGILHNKPGAAG